MAENIETKTQSRQLRLNELLDTSQKKTYFVAAVTVLFVIVMLLVGILPSYSAFTAQAAQNIKRQEAIDALDQKRITIENLVKEEDAKEDLVNEFNKSFPTTTPDQVNVLSITNNIAAAQNVAILSTTFTDVPNTNDIIRKFFVTTQVKVQTVSQSLEGDREQLTNFLSQLEQNVGMFDIISAVVSRKGGKELENTIPGREFKLTVQYYFFYYVQAATQ